MDREDWIPAGELVPGELVDTLTGPVAVESAERLHSGLDVYIIEVHGEHVFRITADGVLVHNACPSSKLGTDLAGGAADYARGARAAGWQAGHIVPWGNFSNRTKSVRDAIVDAKESLRGAGIGLNESWNGFWTNSTNHLGTHTDTFFLELGNRMRGLTNKSDVLDELARLREEIFSGSWISK